MENGQIPNSRITASSILRENSRKFNFGNYYHRLWRVEDKSRQGDWLKVDLGKIQTLLDMDTFGYSIDGVTGEWVETFVLQYSLDGKYFVDYKQGQLLRAGKYNRISLRPTIKARYIKILPKTWHNRIAFWMELYAYVYNCKA